MIRWIAGSLIILSLSACGNDKSSDNEDEVINSTGSKEDYFISVVDDQMPTVVGTRDDIVSLAETVCKALDMDIPFAMLMDTLVATGMSEDDSAEFIGASVGYSCPENESAFN